MKIFVWRSFLIVVSIIAICSAGLSFLLNGAGGREDLSSTAVNLVDNGVGGDVGIIGGNSDSINSVSIGSAGNSRDVQSFSEVLSGAMNGIASSQRELGEVYGSCLQVNLSPKRFLDGYRAIAESSGDVDNSRAMISIAERHAGFCSEVDGGQVIPFEARNLWLDQAAKRGDVAAQAIIFNTGDFSATEDSLNQIIERAISSGDPVAIFEVGQLISNKGLETSGRYRDVSNGVVSGYAWSIYACSSGVNCKAGSVIMDSICLNVGACKWGDFESFVRGSLISRDDQDVLTAKVRKVKELFSLK